MVSALAKYPGCMNTRCSMEHWRYMYAAYHEGRGHTLTVPAPPQLRLRACPAAVSPSTFRRAALISTDLPMYSHSTWSAGDGGPQGKKVPKVGITASHFPRAVIASGRDVSGHVIGRRGEISR